MAVRKKQDDKYLLALRELVNSGAGNRQCFDCGQKGPTYVNMTIGSFVCTRCSGVLRGLTPPHRVKSISMATFTQEELDFLKAHGNELCAKTWLGLWDPKRATPQQDQRELMIDKYERKRYYLEPASPLKSLANAVNLKTSNNALHNGYHNHTGGAAAAAGGGNNNGYASIQLTPPAAQRTAANGLAKTPSATAAISRPQHHQQQQLQQQQDAFLGLSSLNSAGSTSTGALSDTSSCASNGFAGETDFVADFGTANIFDATSARSAGSPAVSSASSVGSSNGYAKVQPIRAAHLQQQQQQLLNGNGTENFADFEHAPIYNGSSFQSFFEWSDWSTPAAYRDPFETQLSKVKMKEIPPQQPPPVPAPPAEKVPQQQQQQQQYTSSRSSLFSASSWFSSCDDSFEDSPMASPPPPPLAPAPLSLAPTNPFLPYMLQSEALASVPEEPSSSSFFCSEDQEQEQDQDKTESSSGNLNAFHNPFFTWSATLQSRQLSQSSPKASSAPSEDRYAALKDLDEQLRELKASEAAATEAPTPTADAFSSANNNNSNVNPFKSQQQQQQQLLLNNVVNPFQANSNNNNNNNNNSAPQQNLFGQLTLIPNGYGSSPLQANGHPQLLQPTTTSPGSFFNFNNNGFAVSQGLPNGCGFGSMQPAPVLGGGLSGAYNNPFAVSLGSPDPPFLSL
ncbi:hypothetical protein KR222_007348 [Zaprionus bogoriensis]|nr:hypothetical protein KR222_007348 [Zaprionus bogoriensis]